MTKPGSRPSLSLLYIQIQNASIIKLSFRIYRPKLNNVFNFLKIYCFFLQLFGSEYGFFMSDPDLVLFLEVRIQIRDIFTRIQIRDIFTRIQIRDILTRLRSSVM